MGKVTDINEKLAAKKNGSEEAKLPPTSVAEEVAAITVPDLPPDVQAALRQTTREEMSTFALSKALPITAQLLKLLERAMLRCKNCHANKENSCSECQVDAAGVMAVTVELTMLSKCLVIAHGPGSRIARENEGDQEEHLRACSDCRDTTKTKLTEKSLVGGSTIILPDDGKN